MLHQLNENRDKLAEDDLKKLEALTKNYVALRSNVEKLRESDSSYPPSFTGDVNAFKK